MTDILTWFTAGYVAEPNTGCWLWTRALHHTGYGHSNRLEGPRPAHRLAWTLLRGPIPAGLVLDHLCRVRSCVNPDHLRLVTRAQNNTENSLGASALHKAKANCPKCGGPYVVDGEGKRRCIPCRNTRRRKP